MVPFPTLFRIGGSFDPTMLKATSGPGTGGGKRTFGAAGAAAAEEAAALIGLNLLRASWSCRRCCLEELAPAAEAEAAAAVLAAGTLAAFGNGSESSFRKFRQTGRQRLDVHTDRQEGIQRTLRKASTHSSRAARVLARHIDCLPS